MDNLAATFSIANSALKAQSQRIRTATENLANAEFHRQNPRREPLHTESHHLRVAAG